MTIDKIFLHSADNNSEQILELHPTCLKEQNKLSEVFKQLKKSVSIRNLNSFFKPLKRLGRGRFATVYLMESKISGEKYAAKVFTK